MKKNKIYALVYLRFFLLISLSVAPLAKAQQTSSPATTSASSAATVTPAPAEDIAIVQAPTDTMIEKRLSNIFKASGYFTNSEVVSKEGLVTLSGKVLQKTQKEWAEKLAANTEGVVAVFNNIEVEKGNFIDLRPARTEVEEILRKFSTVIPYVLAAILVLAVFLSVSFFAARVGRKTAARKIKNPLLIELVAKLFALPVILIGLYLVLRISGLTGIAITVLGGTGALGLIVGFALRNILENYFSGLMLSLRNPYTTGDLVEIAGKQGIVHKLTTRGTILIDYDGNHIIIPNTTIYGNMIINMTANPSIRISFAVEVPHDHPTEKIRQIVNAAFAENSEVLKEPTPQILLNELTNYSSKFMVYFWIDTKKSSYLKMKSLFMETVKNKLEENGIQLAQKTINVHNYKEQPIVKKPHRTFIESPPQETTPENQSLMELAKKGRQMDSGSNLLEKAPT